MKDTLVRFGVAMEAGLLRELDALVEARDSTRSEVLRDLVRAEVTRARVSAGAHAVAALTLVYDHRVRDLTERLTDFQHSLGDQINSALHVHLDHDHCLEVIVMKGASDVLKRAGEKLLATRGVKHGGMELIAIGGLEGRARRSLRSPSGDRSPSGGAKAARAHDHAHAHPAQARRRRSP